MTSLLKTSRRWLSLVLSLSLLAACNAEQQGDPTRPSTGELASVAVSGSGVTVDVVAPGSWQGGFNGAVRITNTAFASPITTFSVVFKLNGSATIAGTPWNGSISAPDASGNRTATHPAWLQYQPIRTGQTWEVGFGGSGTFSGSTIVSVIINGQTIGLGTGGDTTPPSVTLVSSAATVTAAGSVTLTATASDDVGVAKVEFYEGGTLLATDTSAPFTQAVSFTAAHNGSHTYTAKASDAAGNSATSAMVNVQVNIQTTDVTPPQVSLTASPTSLTATGNVTLTASATDNVGVTRVEFYDGATLLGTDTTAPYTLAVPITSASNATHVFTAKAYDVIGLSTTSTPVIVTVAIGTVDDQAPVVSLISSATRVTTAGSITLTAAATDDVGVSRVEFYDGATLLASVTATPYRYIGNLTAAQNGTHTFTAQAFDAAGNSATSAPVSVVVDIGGTTTGPVYTAAGGKFLKDGVELKLYGLNWFGGETTDRVVHGLWTGRQVDDFLTDFVSKGFNALRLPLSPETINAGFPIDSGPYSGNDCTAMCGKDGRTGLEYLLGRMQAAGMYALLDFHTCNPAQLGSGLPGTPIGCSGYTQTRWLADLQILANLAKKYPNVIGIDLTNEPHALTWSAWASLASQGGGAVLAANPNLTVWVEGVGNSSTAGVSGGANWGQNLYEAGAIAGIPSNKLVYSPHSYGPSVAAMSYFSDATFPNNMPALWDTMFGHLVGKGYTMVVGEFGGHYTGADKTWADAFVTYLIAKDAKSSFYWCVNPNSGDTGGVLQGDWKTWDSAKVTLLQRLMR